MTVVSSQGDELMSKWINQIPGRRVAQPAELKGVRLRPNRTTTSQSHSDLISGLRVPRERRMSLHDRGGAFCGWCFLPRVDTLAWAGPLTRFGVDRKNESAVYLRLRFKNLQGCKGGAIKLDTGLNPAVRESSYGFEQTPDSRDGHLASRFSQEMTTFER